MLETLYAKPTHEFDRNDNKNLALAYSVMALGCMYNVPDGKDSAKGKASPYELAIEQGYGDVLLYPMICANLT